MPALRLQRLALAALILALAGQGVPGARADEAHTPVAAAAPTADVFPLANVKPGLKGYGLTVRSGTKIERFEVEVLDVLRTFQVKQDVILVRCLGEDFADHRIAQGMSGSPIYFDGKIAGALAYTWAWARHALGGIKQTGNGHREAGIAGIDVFSEWKTVYVDFSGALPRAQIDR